MTVEEPLDTMPVCNIYWICMKSTNKNDFSVKLLKIFTKTSVLASIELIQINAFVRIIPRLFSHIALKAAHMTV